jgi:uncharacterized protein (TIGR02996 family)
MPDAYHWPERAYAQFQGLLDDIRSSPEDVPLRLILADWLHEHADTLPPDDADSATAWSRLLGLQCAREPSRSHVTAEERDLLATYSPRWLDTLADGAVALEWRLGFVALSGPVADLYAVVKGCDEATFTRVLWLQPTASSQSRARHLDALLNLPQLAGVGVLDLSQMNLGGNSARAVARSPHLAGLRHLTARNVGFGSPEFADLADSRFLRLTGLDLGYNAGGDEGAIALAESPASASLRTLRLQRIDLGDDGARAILESPHLANLRELSLYGNRDVSPIMAQRLEQRFGLGFSW